MCGKSLKIVLWIGLPVGSPPRVREKLAIHISQSSATGITPACAGKASLLTLLVDSTRDHPRVCGKSFIVCCFSKSASGSPPRVREKRVIAASTRCYHGITPACAGKAGLNMLYILIGRDHPRVCGKS